MKMEVKKRTKPYQWTQKKEVQWNGSPSMLLWVDLLFLLKNTQKKIKNGPIFLVNMKN
jgi:hypothetical protein